MRHLPLLALLLLQEDPRLEMVKAGVRFPAAADVEAVAKKSEWHAKVLKIVLDPAHWAESLERIEVRTGQKSEKLDIEVKLVRLEEIPARAHGKGGAGVVELDIDRLAKYAESAAIHDKLKAKGVVSIVPPARTEHIIPHELTHCFQGVTQPLWFLEGMASYVGREPNHVLGYRAGGGKTVPIDEPHPREWIYARGWAFFECLEAKHGADAVKAFIRDALAGMPAHEAAAKAAGMKWEEFRAKERDASALWISRYKEPK